MVQKQEFYRQTIQEAATSLHTDPKRGLSAQEAERRLWENGENRLPEAEKKSVLQSFLEQLNDPLIYVLLAAALISVLLGEYSDAGIIAFVVCLNAAVGVLQEGKAQRALDSLKQLMQPRAVVIRDGSEQEIPAAKLVVGDLVCLQAGAMVPADLRLVEAENLQLQEAALTGENLPVQKQTARLSGKQGGRILLGDRNNMTFLSTMVSGDGLCGGLADPDWKNRGADARKPGGDDAAAKKAGRAWKILKPGLPWNLHRVVFAGDCAEASGVRYASDGDFPCGGSCPGGIAGGGHFVSGTERDADGKDQYDHPASAECGNIGRGFCRLLG